MWFYTVFHFQSTWVILFSGFEESLEIKWNQWNEMHFPFLGYLDKDSKKASSGAPRTSNLQAQSYTIEEKF